MSGVALALVVGSALLHASWNLLTKQSGDKLLFLWSALVSGGLVFLPLLLLGPWSLVLPREAWICILLSGILHATYYAALGAAYELGDLSLVYPLARGSGVLLVPPLALLVTGEHLSAIGTGGVGAVILGILTLHLPALVRVRGERSLRHLPRALLTGGTIALYSVVDKIGVGYVAPLPYLLLLHWIAALLLVPVLWRSRWRGLGGEWRAHWRAVLVVGCLQTLAYAMVLGAMTRAAVSYVAAARELNVLFGALFGRWFLGEQAGPSRVMGAVAIALGVALIGWKG